MAYISNKYIISSKTVRMGLTSIYGIGPNLANQLCDLLGFNKFYKISQLTKSEIDQLSQLINKQYFIEAELKKLIIRDIQHLSRIGTYRGSRHSRNLPLRGQRTHTNAKTARKKKVFF